MNIELFVAWWYVHAAGWWCPDAVVSFELEPYCHSGIWNQMRSSVLLINCMQLQGFHPIDSHTLAWIRCMINQIINIPFKRVKRLWVLRENIWQSVHSSHSNQEGSQHVHIPHIIYEFHMCKQNHCWYPSCNLTRYTVDFYSPATCYVLFIVAFLLLTAVLTSKRMGISPPIVCAGSGSTGSMAFLSSRSVLPKCPLESFSLYLPELFG